MGGGGVGGWGCGAGGGGGGGGGGVGLRVWVSRFWVWALGLLQASGLSAEALGLRA